MGGKFSINISSKSTQQIHTKKKSCVLVQFSTKIVERIVQFQMLDVCHFSLFFVNMGPCIWELKVSTSTTFPPQNSCLLMSRVSNKVVKRIVKFEKLDVC